MYIAYKSRSVSSLDLFAVANQKKTLYLLEVEKSECILSLFPFSFTSYSTIKRIELFHRFLLTNKTNWSQPGPTSPVTPGTCTIYTLHKSNVIKHELLSLPSLFLSLFHFREP